MTITYPEPQERITFTRRDEREVYIRERCPACQGTGDDRENWPSCICRKCNQKGVIMYWQPLSEFLASLGNLVEVKVDDNGS